ncbi:hypothetical protein YPPY60_3197, partial [Yersinia pestis PY-60]
MRWVLSITVAAIFVG